MTDLDRRLHEAMVRTREKEDQAFRQYPFRKGRQFRVIAKLDFMIEDVFGSHDFMNVQTLGPKHAFADEPDLIITILDVPRMNEGGIIDVMVEVEGKRALLDLHKLPWNLEPVKR